MTKSENGWNVIEDQSSKELVVIRIPNTGIPGIPLRVQKDCAPLLAYVASRVHQEVCDLRKNNKKGFQDEAGYTYRKIGTGNKWSNHASGTAIDLNWQRWPMFKKRMSKKELLASTKIAEELSEVIRWGGNYRATNIDQMHWEIKPGVTKLEVKKFIKDRGILKDGTLKVQKARSKYIWL